LCFSLFLCAIKSPWFLKKRKKEKRKDATLTMDNEAFGQCVHGQKLRSASMGFLLKARSRETKRIGCHNLLHKKFKGATSLL
jgi:hypothetical protein